MAFERLHDNLNIIESLQLITGKKLDKINIKNYKKFLHLFSFKTPILLV